MYKCATCNVAVFRIWKASDWQPERWNVISGHINNICWSPCGSAALFTTSDEPQIYCLRLNASPDHEQLQSGGAAVPIMDLSKASIFMENEEKISGKGGLFLAMKTEKTLHPTYEA